MDVTSTAPLRTGAARAAAVDGSALAVNLSRLHGLASMVLDTSGKASDGVRLQAYKALHAMGVSGQLHGMSRSDAQLFHQATGASDVGQKATELQRSYVSAAKAGAQAGGAAVAIKAAVAHFDALPAGDQDLLFLTGINAVDRGGAKPFEDVQGWRDNMAAQHQMVGYMQASGAVGANGALDLKVAATKAGDPKFAAALDLSLDRNNHSASWTAKVTQLLGGGSPTDAVDLSDAAKMLVAGLPSSPSPYAPPAPYRQGSLVSTTA